MTFELYFSDLNENAQQEYLSLMGIGDPKEANLDVLPITTIETPEMERQPELLTLRLYSPIEVEIEDLENDPYDGYEYEPYNERVSGRDAAVYSGVVAMAIEDEKLPDEAKRGLMEYYREDDSVDKKVEYAYPAVGIVNGELWCVTECRIREPLNKEEMDKIKEYLTGQYSDGFGEGLEQRPKPFGEDQQIYVHLWHDRDDYKILTERELMGPVKEKNRSMTKPSKHRSDHAR